MNVIKIMSLIQATEFIFVIVDIYLWKTLCSYCLVICSLLVLHTMNVTVTDNTLRMALFGNQYC